MTEQERAAALADEIKRKNGLHFAANGYRLDGEDYTLVLSALHLLAATPAASPRPKTIFDSRAHWDDVARANGPAIFAALRDLLDAVNERPSLRSSIESVTISRAENAVAQVLSQKPQPASEAVPEEVPAPKWLDRVAEEISEYRGLQAGWDGENAETPSAHSVNEAVEFIRSLERGDIEPALHADGTVIILIGHTTLRFTNEGMSFVTRAAIAVKEPTSV